MILFSCLEWPHLGLGAFIDGISIYFGSQNALTLENSASQPFSLKSTNRAFTSTGKIWLEQYFYLSFAREVTTHL